MIQLNPYGLLIDLKNYLYDRHFIEQFRPDIRIISIGNLNTGGSGKTPIIQYLASIFSDKKILIVCRSYKAHLASPESVDLKRTKAASHYGDEACLLQQLLPWCEVWSGPSKSQTVKAALQQRSDYDLILIDDGFSHRKLFRHKDIVLVDLSRSPSHYRLLPMGRMREDWKTLERSNLVILTKSEGLSQSQRQFYLQKIQPFQKNIITAEFTTVLKSENKKIFLVTGLGNPQKLKQNLVDLGYQIVDFRFYPDHYHFPETEQIKILEFMKLHPDLQLVMTAKDRIKITNPELLQMIQCAELSVSMTEQDRKIFYDTILS